MHGSPCIEHTPWREMKAFWCTAACHFGRTRLTPCTQRPHGSAWPLKVVTQNQDSEFLLVRLPPGVKCSGALNITCKSRKSIWVILRRSLCNIAPAFIASAVHIYIASARARADRLRWRTARRTNCLTHTHTNTHTQSHIRNLLSVFPLAKDFFFPESKIIQFPFFLFPYNTSFSSAFCVHEIHFLMEIFVL